MATTTFMLLPTTLQLKILGYTSRNDHHTLRFVCKHTLSLVQYLNPSIMKRLSVTNRPSRLQLLNKYKLLSVATLYFSNLTTPLPIKSSTRLEMPQANQLVIGPNVSSENVLKLIRYYIKWCTKLVFYFTNLPYLKNVGCFGCSSTCLVNIKTLEIYLTMYDNQLVTNRDYYLARLNSYGQFLFWCSMPSLQKFSLFLAENYDEDRQTPPPIPKENNFAENLQKFLIKHGPVLKYLKLNLSASFWTAILPTFEFENNVEKLVVVYPYFRINFDANLMWKGFNHFTQLKSLCVDPDPDDEISFQIIGHLLANNKNTIQSLDLNDVLTSLSCFHNIKVVCRNLTYLYLQVLLGQDGKIFNDALAQHDNNFQLDTLRKMTISLWPESCRADEDNDWREPFINWLIVFSPNIRDLDVTYFDTFQPRSSDIMRLIRGLTRLDNIRLQSIGEPWRLEPQPRLISPELENWFNNNPQIQVNLKRSTFDPQCVVNIDRPYIFDQQQPDEEVPAN